MEYLGKHYILELYECDSEICNDVEGLKEIMLEAVNRAKATLVKSYFHQFSPYGISGTIVIAESHFNVHTWPEHRFMAIDLFTCGDSLQADLAKDYLIEATQAKRHEYQILNRGSLK